MKHLLPILLLLSSPLILRAASPTEGAITTEFVGEREMRADLLQMLADFSLYAERDYYECQEPTQRGEPCGFFRGESSGQANEAGVRTNADLSMVCAFLCRYARGKVALPEGVTWERLEEMARKSLVFAYSTHKANRLKNCAGRTPHWGSTSASDCVWESSLWAMSVAYSAFFQWETLTGEQRDCVYRLLRAECNYELERTIPTGYVGDTKAEENGWEADVLAVALGLFPDDEQAPRWFERLRAFAVNSYSHPADALNTTVVDPAYDGTTVAELYAGNNLYDDYTLQNHALFHTSYQNVVMQELGEAALALKLFQGDGARWATNALMHNNQEVMDSVLNWLALTDGELAMPNGNDWSLFLFDQITSYSTMACILRDANALMLENMAYKYIKARQKTTSDGAWLLRPDVQARRMGVQAHRVMMTYLLHLAYSTADLEPTPWEAFRAEHSKAKLLPCQNVVRAFTKDRFTTFSWSQGLRSYTGYFAQNSPDKNKIVVPYRANNTGNLLGWYEVSGERTDAVPVLSGYYCLKGDAYTMNGELRTNNGTLRNRFALYSTPGNALIYLDCVAALAPVNLSCERGGLLAISTDELTSLTRTLHHEGGTALLDGTELISLPTQWVNIDDELGIVAHCGKAMAFGDRAANNSIFTSKLYALYSDESREAGAGDIVDRRNVVYYSGVSASTTKALSEKLLVLTDQLPEGWNGVVATDPDGTRYLFVCNFQGNETHATITLDGRRRISIDLEPNRSLGCPIGKRR